MTELRRPLGERDLQRDHEAADREERRGEELAVELAEAAALGGGAPVSMDRQDLGAEELADRGIGRLAAPEVADVAGEEAALEGDRRVQEGLLRT